MTNTLDPAARIARTIRTALARGITQSDGSFVRMDDQATFDLAEAIAAALNEPRRLMIEDLIAKADRESPLAWAWLIGVRDEIRQRQGE